MTAGLRFSSFAASHQGMARSGNEDSYYEGDTVFAVADGMGGHQAGEVASAVAVGPLSDLDGRKWPSTEDGVRALADAVRAANQEVIARAAANSDLRGMGTTLTAVLVHDAELHIAHVGDSRAYLLRPGEGLRQLTTDHTLVEQLVREGRLSREEIATHPQRSVITRAIGVESTVEVDSLPPLAVQPGDQVLLCSDGLSGPVADDEIAKILSDTADGDEACELLLDAANRAGGPDNITVVLLRFSESRDDVAADDRDYDTQEFTPLTGGGGNGAQPAAVVASEPRKSSIRRGVLFGTAAAVLVVGVAAFAGWYVLSRSYFIGVRDGEVTIFAGVPNDVGGLPLHWVVERTRLEAADLPRFRQDRLEAGVLEPSLAEARNTIDAWREQPQPQRDPTPTPTVDAAPRTPSPSPLPRTEATP